MKHPLCFWSTAILATLALAAGRGGAADDATAALNVVGVVILPKYGDHT
jgi:hypothetical protein